MVAWNEKAGPVRELHFDNLEAAIGEAQRLLDAGYERAGNWTLAQAAGHCAQWLDYSMSGAYPVPLPLRPVLSVTSRLLGPRLLRQTLERRGMPAGAPTLAESVPAPLVAISPQDEAQRTADAAAVAQLRETAERFREWNAPLARSPLFGQLDKQTALQLNCLHIAHHLGYLVPRGGG